MDIHGLPRFRGRAIKKGKKWTWEVFVSSVGSNEGGFILESKKLFSSKDESVKSMTIFIKECSDLIQKEAMGEITGTYIDMKTNETLNWNKDKYQ